MERLNDRGRIFKLLVCAALVAATLVGFMVTASATELEWNVLTEKDAAYNVRDAHNAWVSYTEEDGTVYIKNTRNSHGALYVDDKNNVLGTYKTFSMEGDFYFESFPGGPNMASGDTLSFLCWAWTDKATKPDLKFRGIRLDEKGYICVNGEKTHVRLKIGKWYNVRCVFTPESGESELFVNGKKELDFNITPLDSTTYTSYAVRYFDGYYDWSVKMKNLIVKTDNDYEIKLKREDSADFLGYQVSKPKNGTFTLRTLLGVNERLHDCVGYEVLILDMNKNGEIVSESRSFASEEIHDAILDASGNVYNIEAESGYKYVSALEIPNVPSKPNGKHMEIVIRPYVLDTDGIRRYGLATTLVFTGAVDSEGYPVLELPDEECLTIQPTDDTYIYAGIPDANYGTEKSLQVRNTGDGATLYYFRSPYFKFTLSPSEVEALASASSAKLRICITSHDASVAGRQQYDMILQAVGTNWSENELVYNNHEKLAPTGKTLYQGAYNVGSYFTVDILSYLKEQAKTNLAKDGSLTVAFRLFNEEHDDAIVAFVGSRESNSPPMIEIDNSLYTLSLNLPKTLNNGYEPWGYAEYLVDEWFNETVDKVYPTDKNGNLVYYDIEELSPEGYNAQTATGDFTKEIAWKYGTIWSTDSSKGYKATDWKSERFARTLSTLGTSTSLAFLETEFADMISTYDVYGGISNAGIKGTTGYFHTQRIGDRTYIIDPLGNPYFALGMNTVDLGFTDNQKEYAIKAYGSEEAYYEGITRELKATGINLAFGGGETLAVEEGLPTVIGLSVVLPYMNSIGAGRNNFTNGFANNDTMNVFDPDFETSTKARVAKTIKDGGYADNPYVFGYTSDNELASGDDILLRYLTLDPTNPVNSFSYAVAWTWLARRTGEACPTLDMLGKLENYKQINDEFLSFVYARFYDVTRDAIKAVDSNHMYLGSRINGTLYDCEPYHRVAGYYLDIITANLYGGLNPDTSRITNFYRNSGIPFMVTEFFAKGSDAIDANGYPLANSTGAGIVVETQQARADYYEHYALVMLESKACVGWTWYCFRDNDQSVFTSNGTNRLIMLNCSYGVGAKANTFMDVNTGEIFTAEEIGAYEVVYKGADIHSNQNINKGIYNGDFSSTVAVYTYDKSGKLLKSEAYELADHPSSRTPKSGTILTGKNGKTYKIGTVKKSDGGRTETVLTVYKGQYIAFADAIKNVSDHVIGLIKYFDAQ